MDTTPPYWETTVVTPGGMLGPDDICVDGLPVGNLFGFAWNLLVSMSFQFVGEFLSIPAVNLHGADEDEPVATRLPPHLPTSHDSRRQERVSCWPRHHSHSARRSFIVLLLPLLL